MEWSLMCCFRYTDIYIPYCLSVHNNTDIWRQSYSIDKTASTSCHRYDREGESSCHCNLAILYFHVDFAVYWGWENGVSERLLLLPAVRFRSGIRLHHWKHWYRAVNSRLDLFYCNQVIKWQVCKAPVDDGSFQANWREKQASAGNGWHTASKANVHYDGHGGVAVLH